MSLKRLIAREMDRNRERRRGRVVSDPVMKYFDPVGTASLQPVCDIDVGSGRLLRDVPIKVATRSGGRSYVRIGMPVFLERDARGRWQVIGPADRTLSQGNVIVVDESTGLASSGGLTGNTIVREPFSWYGANGAWNNGVAEFPRVRILDKNGVEI